MRVNQAGNLGIGTNSPTVASGIGLAVNGASGQARLVLKNNATGDAAGDGFQIGIDVLGEAFIEQRENLPIRFTTNNTERARIIAEGYAKFSNSGTYVGIGAEYHELRQTQNNIVAIISSTNASQTANVVEIYAARNTTNNTFYALNYYNTGSSTYKFRVADSGDVTNTNNSYGAISDEKMKQDIVDASSQWEDIKGLRVRKFRYKADPTAPLQIGLVAQEAEVVSPGIVDKHPDYEEVEVTDEEGNVTTERQPTGTSTKSVKYSVLYMKAIKALQEAMTRIEALEAEVAALKGAN
jgi:hypothetical protein